MFEARRTHFHKFKVQGVQLKIFLVLDLWKGFFSCISFFVFIRNKLFNIIALFLQCVSLDPSIKLTKSWVKQCSSHRPLNVCIKVILISGEVLGPLILDFGNCLHFLYSQSWINRDSATLINLWEIKSENNVKIIRNLTLVFL